MWYNLFTSVKSARLRQGSQKQNCKPIFVWQGNLPKYAVLHPCQAKVGFFMANLYSTVPYKGNPVSEDLRRLMAQANAAHDWECLKPYPSLLIWWQSHHKPDVLPIARWVSHFRMPFVKSDEQTIDVPVTSGKGKDMRTSTLTYTRGSDSYGHRLCKPNCGECDYITGLRTVEPLPF